MALTKTRLLKHDFPVYGVSCTVPSCERFGNAPNTVSGSTGSNTELSELFGAH